MEKKISTNDISEKDSIKYYLAIFIISSIYAMIVTILNKSPIDSKGYSAVLHYFLDLIVIVAGVFYTYNQNSKIDNKDFFTRFFSLSFVIFVRLIIFTICIGLFLLIFISFFIKLQDINKNLLSYLGPIWKIIFYILLAISFQRINKLKQIDRYNGN